MRNKREEEDTTDLSPCLHLAFEHGLGHLRSIDIAARVVIDDGDSVVFKSVMEQGKLRVLSPISPCSLVYLTRVRERSTC